MNRKKLFNPSRFSIVTIILLTFLSVVFNVYAQDAPSPEAPSPDAPSNVEPELSGADYYDLSETNINYDFSEFPFSYEYSLIRYPYAEFRPSPTYFGRLRISNEVSNFTKYHNFIANTNPSLFFGGIDVYFIQPVRNLSFTTVGANGGTFQVDIYKDRRFAERRVIYAYCGGYPLCNTDLTSATNVSGIVIHSINDAAGLGFDDFRFTLGGFPPTPTPTPTPTPNKTPVGNVDTVQPDGIVKGWTADPDNQNASNLAQFYIDGQTSANFVGQVPANIPRAGTGYSGNHGFEFSIPARFRNGVQHTIYAYGTDLTSGQPSALLAVSPRTFTLNPGVQTVSFEPITNEVIKRKLTNSEIEIITGTDNLRIYPEKKFPEDTDDRKRVRVKAVISPVTAGVKVYFNNFDVDDPSSELDIDENGSDGNDNRQGRIIGQPYPPSAAGSINASYTGTLGLPYAITDSNGVASVTFTVTKQPGDNFVVAASTDESYAKGIAINGTGLKDAANNSLPTIQAKRTKLLTVWRKIHIELDSMGEVKGNFVTGYFRGKGVYVGTEPQWVEIYPSTSLEDHVYQDTFETLPDNTVKRLSYGGRIDIAGVSSLQVLDNIDVDTNSPIREKIKVQSINGNVYLRPNHPFKLYDDDDFNDNDGSLKDGDNGEDVDVLSDTLSHLQPSNNLEENPYAAAYIMPEYDWARDRGLNNSNAEFKLYAPCTPTKLCEDLLTLIDTYRGSKTLESDDFWIGYIIVSYQANTNEDVDPDGYAGGEAVRAADATGAIASDEYLKYGGLVYRGFIGAIIYIEAMRDFDIKAPPVPPIFGKKNTLARTRTAPHELGHQFGLQGDDETSHGIMSYADPLQFVPHHINLMRWRIKSPGE